MTLPKVTTCCYCGSRAALVLGGADRHELACQTCGAPLHDLRAIKVGPHAATPAIKTKKTKGPPKPPPHRLAIPDPDKFTKPYKYHKKRKVKTKARLTKKLISKAFDLIEDAFD